MTIQPRKKIGQTDSGLHALDCHTMHSTPSPSPQCLTKETVKDRLELTVAISPDNGCKAGTHIIYREKLCLLVMVVKKSGGNMDALKC